MPHSSRPEAQPPLDGVIEAILYLYTESRRITKSLAFAHGLTGPQLVVLKMLEPAGRLSLSALSEKIRAKNSTVTGIIDRMERDGLVTRRRSDVDRRVIHIELTTKGRRAAEDTDVEPMQIFRTVLSELGPSDAADLRRILTRLARRVREIVGKLPNPSEERPPSIPAGRGERGAHNDRGKLP